MSVPQHPNFDADATLEQPYHQRPRHILDLVRAGNPETLIETLALAAIELIETKHATRYVLSRSLAMNHELSDRIDSLTAENVELREQIRHLNVGTAA